MKYILSFLLTLALFGCTSPAGNAVKAIGCSFQQCCASLGLEKKPLSLAQNNDESSASTSGGSSVFDIEVQIIHTW